MFENHPALEKGRPVFLIEDSLFFGDPHARPGRFHKQKIALHRASMKAWADYAGEQGHNIKYIEYDRDLTIEKILAQELTRQPFDEIVTADAADFLLEKRLCRFSQSSGVTLKFCGTPMFLTPQDWANQHFDSRKRPFLAAFYQAQRKRMGILVDENGLPEGGKWSFDEDNRKPMPKRGLDTPPDLKAPQCRYVGEALQYVENRFPDYPGQTEAFAYPVTFEGARNWLDQFLQQRFERFGPYEDALSQTERTLFHSLLTPALNIGLLTPQEVVDKSLEYGTDWGIPINSLEGFIRQVIGWREFIYLMYQRHGVEMRNSNFFDHKRDLPKSFWTAGTGIDPIDMVISRVLDTGYSHHIERLMVTGNFMLLCQFDPHQVYDWFSELFIDAYDWVMVPNVYGMSQFADGGIFTTKPYISGSNYVKKMSDYKVGDWTTTWDALFWSFIDRHMEFFQSQHRLKMIVANYNRMDEDKRRNHLEVAGNFLNTL